MAQQCPVCGSGVPDGRATCHICSAPLENTGEYTTPAGLQTPAPQQAQARPEEEEELVPGIPGLDRRPPAENPYAVAGTGGETEVRVSLTGELVESQPPPPKYAPGPGAAAAFPGAPGPAVYGPETRARGTHFRPAPREEAPAKSGSRSTAGVFLLILLLLGGGLGGWWWYNNRTNPKDQALAFYTTMFKDQDWNKLYYLVAFSEEDKKKYPDAETFAKEGAKTLNSNQVARFAMETLKNGLSDIAVGDPTIDGNKATVPTSAKLTVAGRSVTLRGSAAMIKEGGVWKFDATSTSGPRFAQNLLNALGRPDLSALGNASRSP